VLPKTMRLNRQVMNKQRKTARVGHWFQGVM
jgi:hypothetical protein